MLPRGSKMHVEPAPLGLPETRETGVDQINTGTKVDLQWQFLMGALGQGEIRGGHWV